MGLKTSKSSSFYDKVRSITTLRKSWKKVYESGIKSKSDETRKSVQEFYCNAENNLSNIAKKLRERKFKFSPSKGVPKRRPGKKSRPIIVATITDRIVQRCILEVLQNEPGIQEYFLVQTS